MMSSLVAGAPATEPAAEAESAGGDPRQQHQDGTDRSDDRRAGEGRKQDVHQRGHEYSDEDSDHPVSPLFPCPGGPSFPALEGQVTPTQRLGSSARPSATAPATSTTLAFWPRAWSRSMANAPCSRTSWRSMR